MMYNSSAEQKKVRMHFLPSSITYTKAVSYDQSMKPKDINWISDDIEDMIALYKPNSTLLSNNDVDHNVAKDAFMSIFAPNQGSTFVWFNQY